MARWLGFVYGLVCYAIFFLTFLYAVGFVAGVGVPRSIDAGPTTTLPIALAIDGLLLTVFAVQHSGMARPAFKRWWTRIVPRTIERSTYVLASSLALALLFWQWRPLPQLVWNVQGAAARSLLWGVSAAGWLTVLLGTFMVSHAHLFGLSQVWDGLHGRAPRNPPFQTRWLYRYRAASADARLPDRVLGDADDDRRPSAVRRRRHAATSWSPRWRFEERDLARHLGEPYRRYRQRVPAFVPRWDTRCRRARAQRQRSDFLTLEAGQRRRRRTASGDGDGSPSQRKRSRSMRPAGPKTTPSASRRWRCRPSAGPGSARGLTSPRALTTRCQGISEPSGSPCRA